MITKIVSETERSTTVQATTELTKVKFNDAWSYYAIRNDGSAEAYVSKRAFSNTTEDGVISIPAQGVASIPASVKSIYITGSGSVLVLGQNTPSLPFKAASKGGENGGSYELPIATTEILGGVMPDGTTINVDENGVISAVGSGEGGGVTIDSALSDTSENPVQNKVVNSALNNKADKSKYGDTTINVGRKVSSDVGEYSTAEGLYTTASGNISHAEGDSTTASGNYSHAEGRLTIASGDYSHAEGLYTTASGDYSHAEGLITTATNFASHADGHYNAAMTTGGDGTNTTGTAFVIGNGTGSTALSNAFSVQYSGIVKAKSTITASTTADYAEFFEWIDENPNEEDRVGYFVTLDGDKIRIATAADDYILGVVSGEPFVLGNGDCDTWNGMFLRDEFRRTIYEPAPKMVEILDSDGNPTGEFKEVEGEFEGTRPKLNPKYDHTQPYISRFDRKEWAPVGMLGVLAVRHDGTAKVNGYVTVSDGGIATACDKNAENSYRVIKSNSDSVVEIIFR